jgi:broad specificity phosphatase PhoE
MDMFVVRHGESTWNAMGLAIGQSDPPLSDNGIRHAVVLRDYFWRMDIVEVHSSDLDRARSTAAMIAEPKALRVNTFRELRESSLGELEGKRMSDLERSGEWIERAANKYAFRSPHGESYYEVEDRLRSYMTRVLDQWLEAGSLLVVTHVGVIRVLHRMLNAVDEVSASRTNPGHLDVWRMTYQCGAGRIELHDQLS